MWDKSEIRLGENIKKLRKIHGETLHDLAKVVDYGNTTIKNYESGERQPDIQTLRAIATHYGKTVDELLNDMWVHSPPLGAQANFNRIEKRDTM